MRQSFCNGDEPKSGFARDPGERLQSRNVPFGTSGDLFPWKYFVLFRRIKLLFASGREGRQDIVIRVNGTEEAYSEEMTVMEYVSAKGYRTNRIAVEKNGQIVPKSAYESTVIKDGDSLEVVSFVGGG